MSAILSRDISTTGTYLQGISSEEIISTVHARRAPMMHASAGLAYLDRVGVPQMMLVPTVGTRIISYVSELATVTVTVTLVVVGVLAAGLPTV